MEILQMEISQFHDGYLIVSDALMEKINAQSSDKNLLARNIYIKSSEPDKQQNEIEKVLEAALGQIDFGEYHCQHESAEQGICHAAQCGHDKKGI